MKEDTLYLSDICTFREVQKYNNLLVEACFTLEKEFGKELFADRPERIEDEGEERFMAKDNTTDLEIPVGALPLLRALKPVVKTAILAFHRIVHTLY